MGKGRAPMKARLAIPVTLRISQNAASELKNTESQVKAL